MNIEKRIAEAQTIAQHYAEGINAIHEQLEEDRMVLDPDLENKIKHDLAMVHVKRMMVNPWLREITNSIDEQDATLEKIVEAIRNLPV